jgi:sec-independent protein translocase protein TatA
MGGLTGWHILALLVIILLLFGATRLPALARSVGQSMNAFKSEMKKGEESSKSESDANVTTVESQSTDTTPKS